MIPLYRDCQEHSFELTLGCVILSLVQRMAEGAAVPSTKLDDAMWLNIFLLMEDV
jgi:hypothetical protein